MITLGRWGLSLEQSRLHGGVITVLLDAAMTHSLY